MTSKNDPRGGKKYCQHCSKWLPPTAFHKNRSKPDGLSSYCKEGMRKAVDTSRKKKSGHW